MRIHCTNALSLIHSAIALVALLGFSPTASAAPVLAVDFDSNGAGETLVNSTSPVTQPGFTSFAGVTGSGAGPSISSQVIGGSTVTVTVPTGFSSGYFIRDGVTNSGAFTEGAIYQDFVYVQPPSNSNSNLQLEVTGLTPNQPYNFTFYTYDKSTTIGTGPFVTLFSPTPSTTTSGTSASSSYMSGGALSNEAYTTSIKLTSTNGTFDINAALTSNNSFLRLNAFTVSVATPEPCSLILLAAGGLGLVVLRRGRVRPLLKGNCAMFRSLTATMAVTLAILLNSIGAADSITVGSFAGPNDLKLTGSFFLAANVGSTSVAGNLSVGSANFLSLSNALNATGGLATLSGATGGDINSFASLPVFSGGSPTDNANLGTVMHSLSYVDASGGGTPMTVTVNSLLPNTEYQIQVLVSENAHQQTGQREFGIDVNGHVAIPSNGDIIALSYPGAVSGVNQWSTNPTRGIVVTDTFVTGPTQTTATIQAIYGTGGPTTDPNAFFNAFTVQAIPEPSSLVLFGLGAVGIALVARRRSCSINR